MNGRHCYEVFRGINEPCPDCPELMTLQEMKTNNATIIHENLGKTFLMTSSPILDEHGEFNALVHVAKDITEHKKMETELLQAHKMEAIGTLAGGIAHDFNKILCAILGYADMARDDLPEGSQTRYFLDQVLKGAHRAKELVKQILVFSRKGQETSQPLRPSSIIKEALKLMRASLPATIEIHEEIAPDSGTIQANPINIHQIIVNLCTNAFHAMEKEHGILTVKLSRVELTENDAAQETGGSVGPFVELQVQDTGCGMDKATVARIFEPYFTTKEVGKGSGMGLSMVHGIVRSCGGFIRVKSEPGMGSTFHVYFPAIKEDPAMVAEGKKPSPFATRGKERILAVDDEDAVLNIYKVTLTRLGYTVTTHSSSEKALAAFSSSPDRFDLVITDQTMPHLPGSELARELLHIRPDIPIVLCTGYSSMISEKEAEEIGIRKFVMKPIIPGDMTIIVRQILDKGGAEVV